jgi:superfamily II DNA/RNA helicase
VSSTFSDLGLPAKVVASLAERGITEAFPIQAMAIPPALAGRDVCGRAPTGSGKTLAFGLPLAQRVGRGRVARPRALVLAPTRELAAQIHDELRTLLRPRGGSVASFYGGMSFTPQLKVLRRGLDVAVGCPGRIADLVQRRVMILDEVEFVVIDEADRMADMGFLPEVKRLLDQVRPDRQTLLFSATLDGDVDALINRYQRDPVRCEVAATSDELDLTSHRFVRARREDRVKMTADLVDSHGSTVVFCRTRHGADRLADQLQRAGVSAVPIHGGRSQSQRDRALTSFAAGRAQALVATDVAARGIHVDNVGCVIHFDVAGDFKDYVHRSGRTGRAGAKGVVVSIITDADVAQARVLQKALGVPVERASGADRADRPARAARPAVRGARQAVKPNGPRRPRRRS